MLAFTESLSEVMFKFTNVVMLFAPFGIFGAVAYTVGHTGIGIVASLALGGLFLYVYQRGSSIFPVNPVSMPEVQNTQQVGMALFRNYLLPFEIASLLLLVAIVGAVVMAKKRI